MFGGKKEKKVQESISAHLETVCETIRSMMATVNCFINGDYKGADNNAYQTHELESKADTLRREIIEELYKGAFFPTIREDIITYLAKQDKIADRAESCCDFVITQRPKVPEKFIQSIMELARASCDTLAPLKKSLNYYFTDITKVRDSIHDVNAKEEIADTIEWHLTEKIFQSEEMDLAEKMHLQNLIFHLVTISDVIEDAADMLDAVVIKRNV